MGGGNLLIISDKEVSGNYSSPRAVSTTDTARGLFAFRRFRVARKESFGKRGVSESLRSYAGAKEMPLSDSKPLSGEKWSFRVTQNLKKWQNQGFRVTQKGAFLKIRLSELLRNTNFNKIIASESLRRAKMGKIRASESLRRTSFQFSEVLKIMKAATACATAMRCTPATIRSSTRCWTSGCMCRRRRWRSIMRWSRS